MRKAWNKGICHLSEDAKKRIGSSIKNWIKTNGHPKGMKGKKHTEKSKEKIRKWKPTAEQIEKMCHKKEKHPLWKGDYIVVNCAYCNNLISCRPGKIKKYCNYNCLGGSKKKDKKTCKVCNKVLSRNDCNYCSICIKNQFIGSNSPNWKGGTVKLNRLVRLSEKYKKWRSKIYQRDLYTCQNCKKTGGRLEVHHIKSLSLILKEYEIKTKQQAYKNKEIFDLNNGITLCKNCHKLTDNYAGKKLIT